MGQPLSMDLRCRLLAAVDDGMSCRAAAARFGVAPSTAIRWQAQRRETGQFCPQAPGWRHALPYGRTAAAMKSWPSGRRARTSRLKNCACL